ncbi:MAG: hypothetical protein V4608_01245 [Bacteroidota bacterium]
MSSEEIDLLYIFRSIKNGILNLFQRIGEFFIFCLKNIKTLLIFIILGVALGVGAYYIRKKVYITDLTVSHTRLNNGQCTDLINGLTKGSNKDTMLASKLDIDFEVAKQIKSIAFKSLNIESTNDSLSKLSDFKIEVKVYNTAILDSLQPKLLNYLESNEYATKRKLINRLYLDKLEERIKNQIIAVDSLKTIVDKSILPRSIGNGIILGESIDPVKVYQEAMNLSQTQLKINEKKELNNSFELIVGFSAPVSASNLILNIATGFITGLLLGLLWLLRKRIKL